MRPGLICRFPPKDKKGLKIDPGVEASFSDVSPYLPLNITLVRFSEWLQNNPRLGPPADPEASHDVRGRSLAHLRPVLFDIF